MEVKEETRCEISSITNMLLNEDGLLENYIKNHKNDYGFDNTFEKLEEHFKQIHHDFTTALIDMVINKKKYIYAKWE